MSRYCINHASALKPGCDLGGWDAGLGIQVRLNRGLGLGSGPSAREIGVQASRLGGSLAGWLDVDQEWRFADYRACRPHMQKSTLK